MMATATKKRTKKASAKITRLEFLVDESGSMGPNRGSVVEGFNEFVDAMREEQGELLVSLTMFDKRHGPWVRRIFEDTPIAEVSPLTFDDYCPLGGTPLNDALFETVEALGSRVRKKDNAIIVVMTDGEENSSRHHTSDDVKGLVSAREDDGWAFIYLGANHNVWAQGGGLGVNQATTFNFTSSPQGTGSAMRAAASNVNAYRVGGTAQLMATANATPSSIPEDYTPPSREQTAAIEKQRKFAEAEAKKAQRAAAKARKDEVAAALAIARKANR